MKKLLLSTICWAGIATLLGCSAITDFDKPKEGEGDTVTATNNDSETGAGDSESDTTPVGSDSDTGDAGPTDTDIDTDTDSDTDTGTDTQDIGSDTANPALPYSVSANLTDVVTVSLERNPMATLTLDFATPLPIAVGGDDVYIDMLRDGIISVVVESSSGTTQNLNSGVFTTNEPVRAGEYSVVIGNAERTAIDILFWNEIGGYSLTVGADYTARIGIGVNDYFVVETVVRNVQVTI